MRLDPHALETAIDELGQALQSTDQELSTWTAWQQLNVTDEYGLEYVRPYTPAALATLDALYERGDQDSELLHHLAIAYHARAWDLELQDDPGASQAWLDMFKYWSSLEALDSFWKQRKAKAEALGANPAVLDEFRSNLLLYLIEIHIDFIKFYPQNASDHIDLIAKKAPIPLAIRRQVPRLVYEVMTITLPDVEDRHEFHEALSIVEHYLGYFPKYVPALQKTLDIAQRAVDAPLIPQQDFLEILDLSERVEPYWDNLDQHPELTDHVLARPTLDDLAYALAQKLFFVFKHLSDENEDPSLKLRANELFQRWKDRARF